METILGVTNPITMFTVANVRRMPGINEADMDRIEEFARRAKFERTPDMLCPDEGEEEE